MPELRGLPQPSLPFVPGANLGVPRAARAGKGAVGLGRSPPGWDEAPRCPGSTGEGAVGAARGLLRSLLVLKPRGNVGLVGFLLILLGLVLLGLVTLDLVALDFGLL